MGLPLNAEDGGTGGVQGAWNGKIQSRGNGGFAGNVSNVTPATNLGYVGTGTDTGHNNTITNPIPNPNSPPATVEAPPSENGVPGVPELASTTLPGLSTVRVSVCVLSKLLVMTTSSALIVTFWPCVPVTT